MSIPFFSVDFKGNDWLSYIMGSTGLGYENKIDKLIEKRFPKKKDNG